MEYERIIDLVKSTKLIVDNEILKKDVHMKGNADFVTSVDTGISEYIKNELKKAYPLYGFFSEEEPGALCDPCWILDPIDGTTNLVFGYNQCSVSLALYKGGRVVFGVVYQPFTDELFTGYEGDGAFLNGKRIHCSERTFSDSLIEFGAGSTKKYAAEENFELAKRVFVNVVDIRRICSSALSICFIADGRIDGYFEKVLKPWDYAAATLILKEAGGVISTYTGESISYDKPTTIICGNKDVHAGLYRIIKEYYEGEKD